MAFIEFRGENNCKKVSNSSVCVGGKLQSNVADFTAERKWKMWLKQILARC